MNKKKHITGAECIKIETLLDVADQVLHRLISQIPILCVLRHISFLMDEGITTSCSLAGSALSTESKTSNFRPIIWIVRISCLHMSFYGTQCKK